MVVRLDSSHLRETYMLKVISLSLTNCSAYLRDILTEGLVRSLSFIKNETHTFPHVTTANCFTFSSPRDQLFYKREPSSIPGCVAVFRELIFYVNE